jgi:hypothetical protein
MTLLVVVEGTNLHYKPYYNPLLNHMNFINEFVYYKILLLCLTFTPYLPDEQEDEKMTIGTAVNIIVIMMLVVNVLVIAYDSLY